MKRSDITVLLILAAILLLVFVIFSQIQRSNDQQALEESQATQTLKASKNYTDIDGNPVSLEDFIGTRVVASVWASWCQPCVEQLTLLGEVQQKYDDVTILAFNRAEPAATAQRFLQFYELDSKVQLILDPDDAFFTSISGYAMPETIVLDETGTIIHQERGPITRQELEFILDDVR